MINVVLSGGSGTRLWPLSRRLMPKQFLKLFDNKSLFQKTIERNSKFCSKCIVISNEEHYFIALDQLEELGNKQVNVKNTKFLLEKIGRNTAAAIAFGALEVEKEEILFVTPSDHLIEGESAYHNAIKQGEKFAKDGYLVTFGIKPMEPHTGYGYIEADNFKVIKFHEKPNFLKAKEYLKKGNYYWNSGMFMFKAGIFLKELEKYAPKIYEEVLKSYKNRQIINKNQVRLRNTELIPEMSIDYAVMEKSKNLKVVPGNFKWNDLGSFDSLSEKMDNGEAIEIGSKGNFYFKEDNKKVISTIGLENYVVIDTRDALLIAKKGETQKVKEIVEKLKKGKNKVIELPSVVHRPWGTFETLIEGKGYKIKRIIVKPGKRLSLQKHFHRNEHWIVVSGTAEVEVSGEKFLLRPNESTYIKMGETHRLSNPGKIPVVLIEAQVGEYTEEDDIIRIEDDFKRE
jgi:mannose-1-phosphate guanylyltransferase